MKDEGQLEDGFENEKAGILKVKSPEEISSPKQSSGKSQAKFDEDLILKYPSSNKRVALQVECFGLKPEGESPEADTAPNSQTLHISPHGFEFRSSDMYETGSLIKIQVKLPDYWTRKQRLVDYGRIDQPSEFRVLAKVIRTEDSGRKSKKKVVVAQTLIIDSVDEEVLKNFLSEG